MLGNIKFTLSVSPNFLYCYHLCLVPSLILKINTVLVHRTLPNSLVRLSLTNLTCNTLPYLLLESDRKCPQLATHQFSVPQITINLTYALKHGIQKYLTVTSHNQQSAVPTSHLYIMNWQKLSQLVIHSYCILTCSRDFSLACLHAARFSALNALCSAGDNSFSSSSSLNSPCVKNINQDFTACATFEQQILWISLLFCRYTSHLTNLLLD